MKVIEIEKSYLNGIRKGHIIILDDELDNESINDKVEEWCQKDGAGHNHGYEFGWSEVEDEKIIRAAVSEETKKYIRRLERMKNDLEALSYGLYCKANNEFTLNGFTEAHENLILECDKIWSLQNNYNLKK